MEAHTNAISSEVWPIHFQPKSDELLSSWIMRLAIAYSMKYFTFIQNIAASAYLIGANFRTDWDCFAPRDALHYLSRVTVTPYQSIERATLLQQAEASVLSPYWFLSASAIQYCPLCLSEDQYPYFRREWRFAFITCCETHKTFLLDSCPECKATISCIHSRKELEDEDVNTTLRNCYKCQADLSSNAVMISPSPNELRFQQQLRQVIQQGWVNLPNEYRVVADKYFLGIQKVTQKLIAGKSAKILQQAFIKSFEPNNPLQGELPIVSRPINRLSLSHRRVVLNLVWGLIQGWPTTSAQCTTHSEVYNRMVFKEERLLNEQLYRSFIGNEFRETRQLA